VLSFAKPDGALVSIAPLAFEVDHVRGVEQFQIVLRLAAVLAPLLGHSALLLFLLGLALLLLLLERPRTHQG